MHIAITIKVLLLVDFKRTQYIGTLYIPTARIVVTLAVFVALQSPRVYLLEK